MALCNYKYHFVFERTLTVNTWSDNLNKKGFSERSGIKMRYEQYLRKFWFFYATCPKVMVSAILLMF